MAATVPPLGTAPVMAVLVCHDGAEWLPEVLDSLTRLTVRPRHLVAVDTGSRDGSAELLARAADVGGGAGGAGLLDGVLTLPGDTGFGAAVSAALEYAVDRWGDPGRWVWLLHDDSAPEPACLETLLRVAEADSTVAMLGPLGVGWQDARLVGDAGLSLDASGHPQTGIGPSELDPALSEDVVSAKSLQVSEVLAVSSACSLVEREVFERLGGFDSRLPLVHEDTDLGWRINADGHLVLCVPGARMRHAGALREGGRTPGALSHSARVAWRAHGVRTFLVNTTTWSFVVGVPRLVLLALFRAVGFAVVRRLPDAGAELVALWWLSRGRLGLLRARAARHGAGSRRQDVRGLLTSRLTRLRNGVRGGVARAVRGRMRREVASGRASAVTDPSSASAPPGRPAGPTALPAGALPPVSRRRGVAGLRRPADPVVVSVPEAETPEPRPNSRPSPVPREGSRQPDRLVLVPVDRTRVLRELLFAPPVVLCVVLVLFALVTSGLLAEYARFGPGLHGGRLLPVDDLGSTWSQYLASWHPARGGTGSPAPAALLVLAVLGTVAAPIGGPATVLAALMLFGVPLAGMTAYTAIRRLSVPRSWRVGAAAAYALLPVATMSAAHGRLDVVVTHVLVPPLLSGIASVIGLSGIATARPETRHWLGTACLTALGLAVLGAFAPLMHVVLVLLALLGFVLVPVEAWRSRRRVAGLAALVLLPVACLLPWPVTLVRNPEMLLHGLGARVIEPSVGASILALNPGGSAVAWAGGLLVLAAVAALVVAPCRAVLPGVVVALVGWATSVLVGTISAVPVGGGSSTVGWTGAPLVLTAGGLLWIVLAASTRARPPRRLPRRTGASLLVASLAILTCGAALAGMSGPLRAERAEATPALATDLAEPGYLLSLRPGPQPARLVEGMRPRFGTDALVPTESARDLLRRIDSDLMSGERSRVRAALAVAAARGVGFVAVPDAATASSLRALAGDLVEDNGRLADGRRVLRVLLPNTPVHLLGPALAKQARREASPRPESRPLAVEANLPDVAVRVSEGGPGRLLLLGAENQAGWRARVDGKPVPLVTAWGHQVAVPLPAEASEVRVTFTRVPRTTLLAVQAAAILFTVIAALPDRRRRGGDRVRSP